MKKYIAIVSSLVVICTAGVLILHGVKDKNADTPETSAYSESEKEPEEEKEESTDEEQTEKKAEIKSEETSLKSKKTKLNAEILEANENFSAVKVKASDSSDKREISVSLSKDTLIFDEKGQTVRADDVENFENAVIEYEENSDEEYPSQIKNASKITLKDRTHCNVYFYVNGDLTVTRRVKSGGMLESADMPNAGAYCEDGYRFDGWTDGKSDVLLLKNITDSIVLTARFIKA